MVLDDFTPCYGRDELIDEMFELVDEYRCVMFFGGRQAGKTTMLRQAQSISIGRLKNSTQYGDRMLAVYVNLMEMPYDAGPSQFYDFLIHKLLRVLRSYEGDENVMVPSLAREPSSIGSNDEFLRNLGKVFIKHSEVRQLIFLLDEAGRVVGRRFPRAFQDNLYSMLVTTQVG